MAAPPPARPPELRRPRLIPFVGFDPERKLTITWIGWLYFATAAAALFGGTVGFCIGYLVG